MVELFRSKGNVPEPLIVTEPEMIFDNPNGPVVPSVVMDPDTV
jgi:hypothetical protein